MLITLGKYEDKLQGRETFQIVQNNQQIIQERNQQEALM
jgi:hypothetical protein